MIKIKIRIKKARSNKQQPKIKIMIRKATAKNESKFYSI